MTFDQPTKGQFVAVWNYNSRVWSATCRWRDGRLMEVINSGSDERLANEIPEGAAYFVDAPTTDESLGVIPDERIECYWKSEETGEDCQINPDWYEWNGTPLDSEGNDMTYQYTTIL